MKKNTVNIHLDVNNTPVIIEMMFTRVQTHQFNWDAYGQTHSNSLLLSNDTMIACLYLDEALTKRQMERFAEAYKRKVAPVVRLGHPIKAIHYIETGRGWPFDSHCEPRSILNCLPGEEWAGMASRPQTAAFHPLLKQHADTLSFQCQMWEGVPAEIHYDSIAKVVQFHNVVKIEINRFDNTELIGLAIVVLKDEMAAADLAAALRLRLVKRIRSNEMVDCVYLDPKPYLCRVTGTFDFCDWYMGVTHGRRSLWRFIAKADPDNCDRQLRDEDARTATNDGPGVQGAAWTPPALPANKPFTVPALQALTVNA